MASAGAALLPNPLKRLELPGEVPGGFAALEFGAAEPNIFGVEDVEGAADFAVPKSDDAPVFAPVWEG